MNFEVGDVVKLKSGSEKMTIESLADGRAECVWMMDKKIERASFDQAVLKKYEPGATPRRVISF